jgi:hypothetical protein
MAVAFHRVSDRQRSVQAHIGRSVQDSSNFLFLVSKHRRMMFEELGFEPEAFRKKYAAELEEGLSLPRTQSGVTRHAAYATGPIHVTPDWVFGTHNQ